VTIQGIFRRSRFPGVVRYFVRVHAQAGELLHRPSREIHPLEVRRILVCRSWCGDLMHGSRQRQTVFYTPSTITISEGQKIRGRLTCAPNTKNNRDLDITISYGTDGTELTVEYKMCVVFPYFCAASPRLVNSADRWSGVNCIFMFILPCYVALARSKIPCCFCVFAV